MTKIKTISVCGSGTMGTGIAQLTATAGYHTIVFDTNQEVLIKARNSIIKNLENLCEKNKLEAEEKKDILNRIQFTSRIIDCKAEMVIEAIVESYQSKRDLFEQLSRINDDQCIFASNTSSLSISKIAATIIHPNRFAGMHFFNPPQLMKLVEVVKGDKTDDRTIERIVEVSIQLGKTAVLCKDLPGFIVNRVARPYYLEALRIAEKENEDFETIDSLLEATGFRMGPFKLMDLIGNDINLAVTRSLYEACNKPLRFRPSSIQEEKVAKGELGRKSGKGYYDYS
jgi:3-hydroxybutyryl-CoA dehydrogenase